MYQVIKATENLMQQAAILSKGKLRKYYLEHVKEECDHADWLKADLLTVGIKVEEIPLYRESVAMAGSQYYLMYHHHPASLLGYMAVLEGFPVPLSFVDTVEKLHGKDLFRTVRFHAEHDLEHRKELFKMIDAINHPSIMDSAVNTALYMSGLTNMLNNLQEVA
jgi:hypothetical protein